MGNWSYTLVPAETNIPGRVYLGCYLDDVTEFRILNGPAESLSDNTPDRCHKICYRHGYRYFGLTYMLVFTCKVFNVCADSLIDIWHLSLAPTHGWSACVWYIHGRIHSKYFITVNSLIGRAIVMKAGIVACFSLNCQLNF